MRDAGRETGGEAGGVRGIKVDLGSGERLEACSMKPGNEEM